MGVTLNRADHAGRGFDWQAQGPFVIMQVVNRAGLGCNNRIPGNL